MDLKTTLRASVILAKEKIYQGRKDKIGGGEKNRVSNRTLLTANLSMLPLYFMLSFFLVGAQIGTGLPLGAFSLLLLIQLFLSLFTTLDSVSTFRDLDMQEPLLSLPIRNEYLTVSFSWLLSGGASILVVPITASAIYAWASGNYISIPISFLWGVLTVFFGHSIGLMLTNAFSFGTSGRSSLGKLFRFLKIAGALLIFILWIFISTREGFLNPLLEPLTRISETLWFLYPFNASKSIVDFSGVYLFSFAMYGLLFSGLYWLIGSRTWDRIVQPSFAVSEKVEKFKLELGDRFGSLIRKDLTLSFRSGQRFLGIILFPLMILFMNLFNVIQGGTLPLLVAEMVYLGTGILSGWGIIYFYIQEGKSAWVISSLPLSKKEIAFQKALSAFILFPLYAVPAIILVSVGMGFGIIATTLQLLSGFAMALTSCLIISSSLADRLPESPTVITQETFGSNLTPLLLFLKSSILSGWPVAATVGLFMLLGGLAMSLLGPILLLTMVTVSIMLNLVFTLWRYGFLEEFSSSEG